MTAAVIPLPTRPTGRPPAAPAPPHTCLAVLEYWGPHGEVRLWACQVCGQPMPQPDPDTTGGIG